MKPALNSGGFVFSSWVVDTDITAGWFNLNEAYPIFFWNNGTLCNILIQYYYGRIYRGQKWNGTNWYTDNGVINGLPYDLGTYVNGTVFSVGGELYFIVYKYQASPPQIWGYKWNSASSIWESNTAILTGLPNPPSSSYQVYYTSMEHEGNTYVLYALSGWMRFYTWNTTLSKWVDAYSAPTITSYRQYSPFFIGSDLHLLGVRDSFVTYKWSGSNWVTDGGLAKTGIADIGSTMFGGIFYLNNNMYFLHSERSTAIKGYRAT